MEPTIDFRRKYRDEGRQEAREEARGETIDLLEEIAASPDVEIALQSAIMRLQAEKAKAEAASGAPATGLAPRGTSPATPSASARSGGDLGDQVVAIFMQRRGYRGSLPGGAT